MKHDGWEALGLRAAAKSGTIGGCFSIAMALKTVNSHTFQQKLGVYAEWHMISQRVRKSPAQAAMSGSEMLYSGSGKLFIVKVPGISVALLDR